MAVGLCCVVPDQHRTEKHQGNVSLDSSPSLDPVEAPIGGPPMGDMETSVSGDDIRSNSSCFHGMRSPNQPHGKRPRAPGALIIYITSEIRVMPGHVMFSVFCCCFVCYSLLNEI